MRTLDETDLELASSVAILDLELGDDFQCALRQVPTLVWKAISDRAIIDTVLARKGLE